MRFTIDRIDHIVINCKDVEISAAWYQRVLGMEREDFGEQHRTALKFGGQKINLRPFDVDVGSWPTGVCVEPGGVDVCFITAVPPAWTSNAGPSRSSAVWTSTGSGLPTVTPGRPEAYSTAVRIEPDPGQKPSGIGNDASRLDPSRYAPRSTACVASRSSA